jgi:hypothetical protein
MRCSSLLLLNLGLAVAEARHAPSEWQTKNFKTLVTFGDSYTDENRLGYFINHNGSAPPVGWEQGVVCWPVSLVIHGSPSRRNIFLQGFFEIVMQEIMIVIPLFL